MNLHTLGDDGRSDCGSRRAGGGRSKSEAGAESVRQAEGRLVEALRKSRWDGDGERVATAAKGWSAMKAC